MVGKSYLEGQAAPPPAVKTWFDQQVIPVAIDTAGCMEAGVERLAVLVRRHPAALLGSALVLGAGLAHLVLARRRT